MRVWLTAVVVIGCNGEPPVSEGIREGAELIAVDRFELSSTDPLAHGQVDCPDVAWGVEGATLEVDTGLCRYGVFEQSLLADVRPTDVLELVFWHNQLVAEGPATGHLAVAVDTMVVFEVEVPIPAEPAAYTETITGVTAAAGAPIQVHLHNHGANTWNLLHLDRLAEE